MATLGCPWQMSIFGTFQALSCHKSFVSITFDSFKENEVGRIRSNSRAEVRTPKCSRKSPLHELSINSVSVSGKETDPEY